jgi:hypothetical protein
MKTDRHDLLVMREFYCWQNKCAYILQVPKLCHYVISSAVTEVSEEHTACIFKALLTCPPKRWCLATRPLSEQPTMWITFVMKTWKLTCVLREPTADRAIPQAVNRGLPTAAARVRVQSISCGICSGQSGTTTGFLWVLRFPLPILPTGPRSSLYIIRDWYNRPISGRRTKWTQSHHNQRKKEDHFVGCASFREICP